MAAAFKGHVGGTSTNGGNITLNLASPTSGSAPSAGDVVFVISSNLARGAGEGVIGTALSYTEIIEQTTGGQKYQVAWKAWASGENSVVVTGSVQGADAMAAVAVWFSGLDTSDPFSTTPTTATGSSTNPDPPSITPADNDCAILVLAGSNNNDAAPGTITNYTVDIGGGGNDTNDSSAHAAHRILSGGSGVAENPAAFNAWATGAWFAATLALQPGAAPAFDPAPTMFAVL